MTTYQKQLAEKISSLHDLLSPFMLPTLEVFPSIETGYRMRAEFKVWHQGDDVFYAMTGSDGQLIFMENFPPAHVAINRLMPELLHYLRKNPILRKKLFQVEFQATLAGDMLISLIYHKPLSSEWEEAAQQLAKHFQIQCVGRARKEKRIIGRDFVNETLTISGKSYYYRQYENSFSQPNAEICQQMIGWVKNHLPIQDHDLLELYCGNGNFTLPLAEQFRQVLATEISKSGVQALRENIALNNINNIALARLSAEELSEALSGVRVFRRLQQAGITLADYNFSTILVDPPRAGIDLKTLQLLQQFRTIVYISCNPITLAENLNTLTQSHYIQHAALFDQFPQTPHIESGMILEKKSQGI